MKKIHLPLGFLLFAAPGSGYLPAGPRRRLWTLLAAWLLLSACGELRPLPASFEAPAYKEISYEQLLKVIWESHNPTQGMRQGNDAGTQYRSGIYTYSDEQRQLAEATLKAYQPMLSQAGYGTITTEILDAPPYYYAEEYHQQYLAKNPGGYCGLGGTNVSCPVGVAEVAG